MVKLLSGCLLWIILTTTAIAQSGDGTWHLVKTKNKIGGRSECSLVALQGKLYLIGGDGPAQPVEVFDSKTSVWTKKATAPVVMHHLQAVGYGDKIYVLDAFYDGGFPNQSPMPNSYSYDTKTNTWQKLAAIPADRRRAGAGEALYDGKLYLVCGITHGHSSGTNAMFDEYDPKTNSWKALPDAPHIRDHSMAEVIGDKLYAVGGRNTSYRDPNNVIPFFRQVMLDVDCYDFKTGKWSTLDAKLPMGTGGGTAVNLNNKIYYIGGERATDTKPNGPQKDVYYLDPTSSKGLTKTSDLNKARNGVGGAVLDHKIFIAGGAGPGGPPPNGKPPGMPAQPKVNSPQGVLPQGDPPILPPQGGPPIGPPQAKRPGGSGDIALEVFILK